MDKYHDLAAREGVGLLKRFIHAVMVTEPVTTEDIEQFLKKEKEQVRFV